MRSTSLDMIKAFPEKLDGRFMKENLRRKKLHRTNQGYRFVRGRFSNRGNVRTFQFRKERQSQHLNRWFLVKGRTIHFFNVCTRVIWTIKWEKLVLSWKSESSSEANFSYCYKPEPQSHLGYWVVSSAKMVISHTKKIIDIMTGKD